MARSARLQFSPEEAVAHLQTADSVLGTIIEAAGSYTVRPDPKRDVYQALLRSIVFQQLSGKAASTILERVLELWDGRFPTPEELASTEHASLRACGLSNNKTLAIHDLGLKTADGTVPTMRAAQKLSDEELVELLTQVRGIGPWTVEMLLIFQLGRPDVLPVGDLGVRKGFGRMIGAAELPDGAALAAHAEVWRPFRSVASWYMWRAVDLDELPL